MIFYDGIIYSLQGGGGISVLFNELVSRLPQHLYYLKRYGKVRYLERYRRVPLRFPVDIFHSTYYRLPYNGRCAVVTTVHDFTYEKFSSGIKKYAHSLQKKNAVMQSDLLLCVSNSTKADLLEFYGKDLDSKIRVVHNGVSHDYCFLGRGFNHEVLFVGTRQGYKNFISVVKALSFIKDLTLVCVGGGGFSSQELDFLEKNLPGRYRHAGYISNDELNVLYNTALCLVYPSLYEGFGIPILEAMRAGCPVIAVNASSIPEVAGNAALLLEKGSPEEIACALEAVSDLDTRRVLVDLGLARGQMFSWDMTYKKTIEAYEELLGRNLL